MQAIPATPEADWAIALDISKSNQVVGQFTGFRNGNQFTHAFYWEPGLSQFIDLNEVVQLPDGWVLIEARGVSDPGRHEALPYIVGTASLPDGTSRPYLLHPQE
jgi:hypothetical protein